MNFDSFLIPGKKTAPELLREMFRNGGCTNNYSGTREGDVYSFGIILHEILVRKGTFYLDDDGDISCVEILRKVAAVNNETEPLMRPSLAEKQNMEYDLVRLLELCWAESLNQRPDFNDLRDDLKRFRREKFGANDGNLLDKLVDRLENYASNLEELVKERTQNYLDQRNRVDNLLYEIMPKPVADKLKNKESVPAEEFKSVTIFFSDIVGFTALASSSTPYEIVQMLNDLYVLFDRIIEGFDVYKVETIGDAYMFVSGLPNRNGKNHAREVARCSLRMLENIQHFIVHHKPGEKLKLRIGIHTGPCVAGVVGLKMPRYCLFGDTVNTAARMEQNGLRKFYLSILI